MKWVKNLSKQQILYLPKLKEFAGDNCKFDENGREFSKMVENTIGKGEIACDEQFVLFPQCFQKIFTADILKQGLVCEREAGSKTSKYVSVSFRLFVFRKFFSIFNSIPT